MAVRSSPYPDEVLASSQVSGLVELASGIDALYLSGRCELPRDLVHSLESAREQASGREPVPFSFGNVEFRLAGHGWGKYRFRLEHPHGLVGLTESRSLPTVRVQPRAEFLHGVGPVPAFEWFDSVLSWESDDVTWSASRIDVFSDWQGWELSAEDRERFVCRATRRDLHEDSEMLTGFEFGRRTTKTICGRIYDKTLQVQDKGLDWWPELWGSRFDAARRVLRVEFEIGREAIREFGLDSPLEVLDASPRLWASVTEDWLTFRNRTSDQTRARWPVASEWAQIQRASMRSEAIGLDRTSAGQRAGSLRKLMPGLNGYLAGFAVHVGAETIDDTLAALPPHLRDYEFRSGTAFADRIFEKRSKAS